MKGSIPAVLKLALWALRPVDKKTKTQLIFGLPHAFTRIVVAGPFLQALMALPGMAAPWEQDTDTDDTYKDFPGYHWEWPEFAINKFDMRPGNRKDEIGAEYSAKPRQLCPSTLVVYDPKSESWKVEDNPASTIPFVFISFTRAHFHVDENEEYHTTRTIAEGDRTRLEQMSRYVTRQFFQSSESPIDRADASDEYYAYWLDYQCGCKPGANDGEMDQYISTICDVVRSAKKVIITLPCEPSTFNFSLWGKSLWTLSEGLLANGNIKVCWPSTEMYQDSTRSIRDPDGRLSDIATAHSGQEETICHTRTWTKLELTRIFKENEQHRENRPSKEVEQPMRVLAEHFSGTLELSRIELFVTALAAFGNRFSIGSYKDKELSQALMALLHHRINPTTEDSLFHSLAKVNMANDSDDLIERMICWSPSTRPVQNRSSDLFSLYHLSFPDQFGSRIWNIKPMCEVVGLAKEENTLMIDGCRAMSIRWKNFPRMQYKRSQGFKKRLAEFFVRSGGAWTLAGCSYAITYLPFFLSDGSPEYQAPDSSLNLTASSTLSASATPSASMIPGSAIDSYTDDSGLQSLVTIIVTGLGIAIGFFLSLFGPVCVRRLYGGSVMESTARLVAFEGILPRNRIEEMIFGNDKERLTWQPSATPLSEADRSDIRVGKSPSWLDEDFNELNYQELDRVRQRLHIPPDHRIFTLVDTGRLTLTLFSARCPPSVALLCGRDGGMLRAVLCSWDFKTDCLYKEAVVRMPSEVWESATAKSWLKVRLEGRKPIVAQ